MSGGEAVWLVYQFQHGSIIAAFTSRADLVHWLKTLLYENAKDLYLDRYDIGAVDPEVFPIGFNGWELLQ